MNSKVKRFNPEVFFDLIVFLLFDGMLLYLIFSKQYLSYVTPRMRPYLIFTAVILLLWSILSLKRLFVPKHRQHFAHGLVLLIPLFLLSMPNKTLTSVDAAVGNVPGNLKLNALNRNTLNNTGNSGIASVNTASSTPSPAEPSPAEPPQVTTELAGIDPVNRTITIPDDLFGKWLTEFYANAEAYIGYEVILTGSVYTDDNLLPNNQFMTSRLTMSCCVADLSPAGLVCDYDQASSLTPNEWVTVRGKFFIGETKQGKATFKDPHLQVEEIKPAKEVQGYVFF